MMVFFRIRIRTDVQEKELKIYKQSFQKKVFFSKNVVSSVINLRET